MDFRATQTVFSVFQYTKYLKYIKLLPLPLLAICGHLLRAHYAHASGTEGLHFKNLISKFYTCMCLLS